MERLAGAAAGRPRAVEGALTDVRPARAGATRARGLAAALVATVVATILVAGCNGPAAPRSGPPAGSGADLAGGPTRGSNRGTPMTTTSPDLSALASRLAEDVAHDIPPFGANSVKLARGLGPAATAMLAGKVAARGGDAFLALEALRAADPAGYAAVPAADRAAVYAAALQRSAFFNSWGQPGMSLTDTSHAFAQLGDAAVAVLTPLLDDQRAAPSSGSQDATLARMNGNRVCDYAWVLISEARGADYAYAASPAERDREIAAMRAALGARRP
ncbi:MAG TPA: hypothetical protein VFT22_37465 [Kofleriaceae bacterium]|nr:hypothetical protein [Kofleriaceae bacterium]